MHCYAVHKFKLFAEVAKTGHQLSATN